MHCFVCCATCVEERKSSEETRNLCSCSLGDRNSRIAKVSFHHFEGKAKEAKHSLDKVHGAYTDLIADLTAANDVIELAEKEGVFIGEPLDKKKGG